MDGAPEAACHLVWLDCAPASRTLVGGKGSSLSQLAALGAPVPPRSPSRPTPTPSSPHR